jgi:hypothetical protein
VSEEARAKGQHRILVIAGAAVAAVSVAAAVAVILLSAGGGTTPASASAQTPDVTRFMNRVVRNIVANRYGRVWELLNPEHQRVAPKREYIRCEQLNPIKVTLSAMRVLSVSDRWFAMPGRSAPVHGKEIRVRLTLANPKTEERAQSFHVFHAVRVGSRWTYILPQSAYELYRTDTCF